MIQKHKLFYTHKVFIYLITISKKPLTISIIRKTLPALKRSVLRDFLNISKDIGLYWDGVFNKSENTFSYNGHTLEFFSADDSQKIRGSARDIAWLNEGNELLLEEYRQIAMRTRQNIMIDFNPSDPVHWIYDLCERDDAELYTSTYKDNKFLPKELVKVFSDVEGEDIPPPCWRFKDMYEPYSDSDRGSQISEAAQPASFLCTLFLGVILLSTQALTKGNFATF